MSTSVAVDENERLVGFDGSDDGSSLPGVIGKVGKENVRALDVRPAFVNQK